MDGWKEKSRPEPVSIADGDKQTRKGCIDVGRSRPGSTAEHNEKLQTHISWSGVYKMNTCHDT